MGETLTLSKAYRELFDKSYEFCSEMAQAGATLDRRRQRVRYWGALSLLRCVMSSPAAAVAALEARHARLSEARGCLTPSAPAGNGRRPSIRRPERDRK